METCLSETGVMLCYAKSLQSCLNLCDPIDSSLPGSPVPRILQARTLEWVAISSNAWKWKVKVKSLSRVRLLATPWTAAYQAPPSLGFSRQEYWSGVPLPSLDGSKGKEFYRLVLRATVFSRRCVRKEVKHLCLSACLSSPQGWRAGSVCQAPHTVRWGQSWLDNTQELWAQHAVGLGLRVRQFSFHNDKEQEQSPVLPERGAVSAANTGPAPVNLPSSWLAETQWALSSRVPSPVLFVRDFPWLCDPALANEAEGSLLIGSWGQVRGRSLSTQRCWRRASFCPLSSFLPGMLGQGCHGRCWNGHPVTMKGWMPECKANRDGKRKAARACRWMRSVSCCSQWGTACLWTGHVKWLKSAISSSPGSRLFLYLLPNSLNWLNFGRS